jgi:16S rRNA (uracil1498-N3)-methyltransferase
MSEVRSFYYDGLIELDQNVQIKDSDFHHIKNVLRLQISDLVLVLAKNGKYTGTIVKFMPSSVQIEIKNKEEDKIFLPKIHLWQGIPKGWKMDEIIEKSTEMGVSSIYPIYMDRSIPKFSTEEEINKLKRWEKIAIAASKQSRRNNVPKIYAPRSFKKQIYDLDTMEGGKIICWELEQNWSLANYLRMNRQNNYTVVIGPEGGISREEKEKCEEQGFNAVSLGDTILRTETAAPFSIGLIAYLWNHL